MLCTRVYHSLQHQKYAYVVHAEANAILHAPRSLVGSRCYVSLFPCHECAKLLASSKVDEIIYLSDKHKHTDSTAIARRIFDMAGIKYRPLVLSDDVLGNLSDHLLRLLNSV